MSGATTETSIKKGGGRLGVGLAILAAASLWAVVFTLDPFRADFLTNPQLFILNQFGKIDFYRLLVFVFGAGTSMVVVGAGARSLQRVTNNTTIIERSVPSDWWTGMIVNFTYNTHIRDPTATPETVLNELRPMIPGLLSLQDKIKPEDIIPQLQQGAGDGTPRKPTVRSLMAGLDPKRYDVDIAVREEVDFADVGKATVSIRTREGTASEEDSLTRARRSAKSMLNPKDVPSAEMLDMENKRNLKDKGT